MGEEGRRGVTYGWSMEGGEGEHCWRVVDEIARVWEVIVGEGTLS